MEMKQKERNILQESSKRQWWQGREVKAPDVNGNSPTRAVEDTAGEDTVQSKMPKMSKEVEFLQLF